MPLARRKFALLQYVAYIRKTGDVTPFRLSLLCKTLFNSSKSYRIIRKYVCPLEDMSRQVREGGEARARPLRDIFHHLKKYGLDMPRYRSSSTWLSKLFTHSVSTLDTICPSASITVCGQGPSVDYLQHHEKNSVTRQFFNLVSSHPNIFSP